MKKFCMCVFFFIVLFKFDYVCALSVGDEGYIIANGVLFNSEPNYKGTHVLISLDTGDLVKVISSEVVESTQTKCKTGFYNVSYYWASNNQKTYSGYVCADYVSFNVDNNKYQELSEFPDSYRTKLTLLKDVHPNWKFTMYKTSLNWEDTIKSESIVGKSYIQSSNPIYLSLDGGSYDPQSKKYKEMEIGGWYAANKEVVAYYMDPRNFLDEVGIFMFENLNYNSLYQTLDVVKKVLSNTDLIEYAPYFMEAATYKANNVSPIALSSRSRQEVVKTGGGISDSANGSEFEGRKVYNFYNINALSSCSNPVNCALEYAYKQNWFDPKTAITEGAVFLASSYINQKQNTVYFQKFNVTNNKYGNYAHQYMTNIQAAFSEATSTQKAYGEIDNVLNSTFEFVIPVYEDMPDKISSLPTKVDDSQIPVIPSNPKDDNQNTQSNNSTDSIVDFATLISAAGYRYDGDYISGINLNATASSMINQIKSINNQANVSIISDGKNLVGNETLGTNDIVNISIGNQSKTYRLIIYGDITGDSKISILDLLKVQKKILNSTNLSGAYLKACDVNRDGKITVLDLLKVQKQILGVSNIEQ